VDVIWILYYVACAVLWVFLTGMAVLAFIPAFPDWLRAHRRVTLWLLGIDQLPAEPAPILRRFYVFLAGGWTWLLVWSWWLMPAVKDVFYRSIHSTRSYHIARTATFVVLLAYVVFGFYCIGRAIYIWMKKIYGRTDI